MTVRDLHSARGGLLGVQAGPRTADEGLGDKASRTQGRARALVELHYDFVWRTLRYLGVPDANVEDAAQHVFVVLARRLDSVTPGAEMAFLFSTSQRVASELRRAARSRPIRADDDVEALESSAPSAEQLLDDRRALDVLRRILDGMPLDLRLVFVLFELEELTLGQVASLLRIPPGTAASRLRRGREAFQAAVKRMHAMHQAVRAEGASRRTQGGSR